MTSQINAWLAHVTIGMTRNSILTYRMAMMLWLEWAGERKVTDINTATLNEFIKWMLIVRGNKPRTAKFRVAAVKRFFQWLCDNRELPDTTMDQFAPRRLIRLRVAKMPKRAITLDEHRACINTVAAGYSKTWWIAACMIAWPTGLRLSDISVIRWANIDFNEEVIRLTPRKTAAMGKTVSIPMDDELTDFLIELAKQPYYTSPYVIPDMAGLYNAGGDHELSSMFREIALKAKLTGVTFHCYRHAFVTRLINSGVEPLVIASMTGQSIRQIADYAHVSNDAKKDALDRARQTMHKHRLRERKIIA